MIKYSLYITEKQDQELRELCSDTTTSVSELIRTAINNFIKMIEYNKSSSSPSRKKHE